LTCGTEAERRGKESRRKEEVCELPLEQIWSRKSLFLLTHLWQVYKLFCVEQLQEFWYRRSRHRRRWEQVPVSWTFRRTSPEIRSFHLQRPSTSFAMSSEKLNLTPTNPPIKPATKRRSEWKNLTSFTVAVALTTLFLKGSSLLSSSISESRRMDATYSEMLVKGKCPAQIDPINVGEDWVSLSIQLRDQAVDERRKDAS